MGKNLQKVQDMLDGKSTGKIQVGALPTNIHANRKIGDRWIDHDGKEWEQKDGYRANVSKVTKGIWNTCNDCDTSILTRWDKHMYKLHSRCRTCQINFEAKLRTWPVKYFAWVRLKELQNMEQYEKDMESRIFEIHEENKTLWDMSVANAMANDNVSMDIKKNT